MGTLAIEFGEPEHGWLPVRLRLGEKEFDFAGSDVLNNPLEDLVDALYAVGCGSDASVWWFLEPGGYWFDLTPMGELVRLEVFLGESMSREDRKLQASYEGKAEEVLIPVCRAAQRVVSTGLRKPHWPPVDESRLKRVREVLRDKS